MNKIKPIEKGQCNCCANSGIHVKKCKLKQCDYLMCSHCYDKYYQTNTLCPACRTEVETNLYKILTNYINHGGESDYDDSDDEDIENNRPQQNIYRICCNCLNRFYMLRTRINCNSLHDISTSNTNFYRYYFNKFKDHCINLLSLFMLIILVCILITCVLTLGRLIYLFTVEIFFPGSFQPFLINNIIWLLLTCILGLLFTVMWLYSFFCCGAVILTCSGLGFNDNS